MKLLIMLTAALALGLGACKSLGGADTAPPSTLKGVFDSKYLLRLAPAGADGIFEFEVCAAEGMAGGVATGGALEARFCVDAFKTNTQENLLLTFEAIQAMSLSEEGEQDLLATRQEYQRYQQALSERGRDVVGTGTMSAGLVFGGHAGAHYMADAAAKAQQRFSQNQAELLALKKIDTGDAGAALSKGRIQKYRSIAAILQEAEAGEESLRLLDNKVAAEAARLDVIQQAILDQDAMIKHPTGQLRGAAKGTLHAMMAEAEAIKQKFAATGLTPEEAGKALLRDGDDIKSLMSQDFIDFLVKDLSIELGQPVSPAKVRDLAFHPDLLDIPRYTRWTIQGGTIDQVVRKDYIDRVFKFNQIENAFTPLHAVTKSRNLGLANLMVTRIKDDGVTRPTNLTELRAAFEQGDFRFLWQAQDFVKTKGVAPTAQAMYVKLRAYERVLPQNYNQIVNLSDEAKRLAAEQDKLIGQLYQQQTKAAGRMKDIAEEASLLKFSSRAGGQTTQEMVTQLSKEADQLARTIHIVPKGIQAIGILTAALVGGVVTLVAAKHVQAESQAQSVIDGYDQLQVLLENPETSPLFAQSQHELLPNGVSVEAFLQSFATWQATSWVDEDNTGVVLTHVCLPQVSAVADAVVQDCQPVKL